MKSTTLLLVIICFFISIESYSKVKMQLMKRSSKSLINLKNDKMTIEIWSDVLCPWCYIGKRQFENALAEFPHREKVDVIWKSYELDPNSPKNQGIGSYDMLAKKYGVSREQSIEMHNNVTERAKSLGLEYNFEKVLPTNSFDAHRLTHLAKEHNLQYEMIERLSKAYFTNGKDISKYEVLKELAKEIGLDENIVSKMLNNNEFSKEVRADEQEAKNLGISGVPFFVLNRKYGISGAQGSQVFLEALNQAWDEYQK